MNSKQIDCRILTCGRIWRELLLWLFGRRIHRCVVRIVGRAHERQLCDGPTMHAILGVSWRATHCDRYGPKSDPPADCPPRRGPRPAVIRPVPLSELLDPEEQALVERVVGYPGRLDYGQAWRKDRDAPVWTEPERLGMIAPVGSYKWMPTSRLVTCFKPLPTDPS